MSFIPSYDDYSFIFSVLFSIKRYQVVCGDEKSPVIENIIETFVAMNRLLNWSVVDL